MAKQRKHSRSAGSDMKGEMHRYKRGTAKSGPGGRAGKVKSRKQAIAIGLWKSRTAQIQRLSLDTAAFGHHFQSEVPTKFTGEPHQIRKGISIRR